MAGRKKGRARKRLSPEELAERSAAVRAKLETGVRSILEADEFKRYLDFSSRFHSYSWANAMLIMVQRPDATLVAGYREWQGMGRHVRKGESGIRIRTPRFRKKSERASDDESPAYFAIASVFDVSQTDGDELPSSPDPVELTGEPELGDAVVALARHYCAREDILLDEHAGPNVLGDANGVYGIAKGKTDKAYVKLSRELYGQQKARTTLHELSHHETLKDGKTDRATGELIAEGTAYVVCAHFGIDASSYSFPYIANWAEDVDKFKGALRAIQKTAQRLIDALEDVEVVESSEEGAA